jgi:methylmalonyl-CoA mutase N-terminal domain/subunit
MKKAADSDEKNLMYPILKAVQNYASIGEMCDALREIWGEYEEPPLY